MYAGDVHLESFSSYFIADKRETLNVLLSCNPFLKVVFTPAKAGQGSHAWMTHQSNFYFQTVRLFLVARVRFPYLMQYLTLIFKMHVEVNHYFRYTTSHMQWRAMHILPPSEHNIQFLYPAKYIFSTKKKNISIFYLLLYFFVLF